MIPSVALPLAIGISAECVSGGTPTAFKYTCLYKFIYIVLQSTIHKMSKSWQFGHIIVILPKNSDPRLVGP